MTPKYKWTSRELTAKKSGETRDQHWNGNARRTVSRTVIRHPPMKWATWRVPHPDDNQDTRFESLADFAV